MVRRWAIVAVVGFAGCESLKTLPAPAEPPIPQQPSPVRTVGETLLSRQPSEPRQSPERGKSASPTEPIPPKVPPDSTNVVEGSSEEADSLALAADCIERGDHAKAATHLEAHVRVHPDQLMFRVQLAEMLMRAGRDEAAKVHFEQFAADVRRSNGVLKKHLVHVHTRLMEIGQQNDDRFTEVFHRGVGLLLLHSEQTALPDHDDDFCEEMLCQALKALTEARELKPSDMQVRLQLAEAYDRMGNRRAADAERAVTRNSLTPPGTKPSLTLPQ